MKLPSTEVSLPLLSLQLSIRLSSGVALGATMQVSLLASDTCRRWLSEGSDERRVVL